MANAIDVVREDNTWKVKRQDGTVIPSENNLFRAIEKAVASLPNDRTTKQTIRILAGSGSTYAVTGGPANLRSEGNFILDCGGSTGMRFQLSSGGFLSAHYGHNSEVRNLNVIGTTSKFTIHYKNSNNVKLENINVDTPGGSIGMRLEGTWEQDLYAKNTEVLGNCRFTGLGSGSHGIETMALDGFKVNGTVTTRNTGGCGILLNQTKDAHIHRLDAQYASYDPSNSHNYAALRFANNCAREKGISVNYLTSYRCGRGFVVTTSPDISAATIQNANISESANYGINLDTSPKNIRIYSGRSVNNLWDGINIGDAQNCRIENLQLTGNKRRGLQMAAAAGGMQFINVNVDNNTWESSFSWDSITNATGSDLYN